jgi:hypothetical protein
MYVHTCVWRNDGVNFFLKNHGTNFIFLSYLHLMYIKLPVSLPCIHKVFMKYVINVCAKWAVLHQLIKSKRGGFVSYVCTYIACQRAFWTQNMHLHKSQYKITTNGLLYWPRGEFCLLEECSPLHSPPWGEHALLFRRLEGRTEGITSGDNFTPRRKISLLGDHSGWFLSLGSKLRMAVWFTCVQRTREGVVEARMLK